MIRRSCLFAFATLLAGCGASSDRITPVASYAATNEPAVNCLSISQIRDTRVIDERTIDFYMVGSRIYRNTLPDSCPGLTEDRAFGYRLSTDQLCSVDIITVLHPSTRIPGASCGLGRFQPIARTPAAH